MSVKEEVIKESIKESIKRIEKRSAKLDALIFGNPLSRVLEIRIEASAIFKKHKGDYKTIGVLIEPLGVEEAKQMKLAKAQIKNSVKWAEEKSKIDFELGQLKSELYFINRRLG